MYSLNSIILYLWIIVASVKCTSTDKAGPIYLHDYTSMSDDFSSLDFAPPNTPSSSMSALSSLAPESLEWAAAPANKQRVSSDGLVESTNELIFSSSFLNTHVSPGLDVLVLPSGNTLRDKMREAFKKDILQKFTRYKLAERLDCFPPFLMINLETLKLLYTFTWDREEMILKTTGFDINMQYYQMMPQLSKKELNRLKLFIEDQVAKTKEQLTAHIKKHPKKFSLTKRENIHCEVAIYLNHDIVINRLDNALFRFYHMLKNKNMYQNEQKQQEYINSKYHVLYANFETNILKITKTVATHIETTKAKWIFVDFFDMPDKIYLGGRLSRNDMYNLQYILTHEQKIRERDDYSANILSTGNGKNPVELKYGCTQQSLYMLLTTLKTLEDFCVQIPFVAYSIGPKDTALIIFLSIYPRDTKVYFYDNSIHKYFVVRCNSRQHWIQSKNEPYDREWTVCKKLTKLKMQTRNLIGTDQESDSDSSSSSSSSASSISSVIRRPQSSVRATSNPEPSTQGRKSPMLDNELRGKKKKSLPSRFELHGERNEALRSRYYQIYHSTSDSSPEAYRNLSPIDTLDSPNYPDRFGPVYNPNWVKNVQQPSRATFTFSDRKDSQSNPSPDTTNNERDAVIDLTKSGYDSSPSRSSDDSSSSKSSHNTSPFKSGNLIRNSADSGYKSERTKKRKRNSLGFFSEGEDEPLKTSKKTNTNNLKISGVANWIDSWNYYPGQEKESDSNSNAETPIRIFQAGKVPPLGTSNRKNERINYKLFEMSGSPSSPRKNDNTIKKGILKNPIMSEVQHQKKISQQLLKNEKIPTSSGKKLSHSLSLDNDLSRGPSILKTQYLKPPRKTVSESQISSPRPNRKNKRNSSPEIDELTQDRPKVTKRPLTPDNSERPMTPDNWEGPMTPDITQKPPTPDITERPLTPEKMQNVQSEKKVRKVTARHSSGSPKGQRMAGVKARYGYNTAAANAPHKTLFDDLFKHKLFQAQKKRADSHIHDGTNIAPIF